MRGDPPLLFNQTDGPRSTQDAYPSQIVYQAKIEQGVRVIIRQHKFSRYSLWIWQNYAMDVMNL
jgi:hypothetical protein